jgi:hypothetical protein
LGRIGWGFLLGGALGGYLAFLGISSPRAALTIITIAIAALLLAGLSVYGSRGSWQGKVVRLLLNTLLFGALLVVANWVNYRLWGFVHRADPLGGWLLPIFIGSMIGLSGGVSRALRRPEGGGPAAIFSLLIIVVVIAYCAFVFYRAVGIPTFDWRRLIPESMGLLLQLLV